MFRGCTWQVCRAFRGCSRYRGWPTLALARPDASAESQQVRLPSQCSWFVPAQVSRLTAMLRKFRFLCVITILLGVTGCHPETVLEHKDVQSFRVVELKDRPQQKIRISGLTFMSAMSVRRIETRARGNSIMVLVFIALAKQGQSGSFSYDLSLSPSVQEVRFGKNEIVIWRRTSGS